MNEKSNPMPMMYKTIPAVAELNKVPGFDPLKFLRHKVSRKTNEEMLQLELPYQKLWFRLRHPQGRMKLTTGAGRKSASRCLLQKSRRKR